MSSEMSDPVADDIGNEVVVEEEELETSNDRIPPTKKHRGGRYSSEKSAVWDHFSYDGIGKKTSCGHCNYVTSDRNPSNLLKHLRRKHPTAAADVEAKTSQKRPPSASSTSTVSSSTPTELAQAKLSSYLWEKDVKPYSKNSPKHVALMDSLSVLFAAHSLPRLLVESPHFSHFVHLLDPKFQLPNRRALANEITNVYEKLKHCMMEDIQAAKKICIILDIWTKRGLSESYLGVLVRYFQHENGKRKMALIALQKMEGKHTAEAIRANLDSILDEWQIDEDKISFYVTDSGSNIVKALKELVVELAPFLSCSNDDGDEEHIATSQQGEPAFGLEEEMPEDDDDTFVQHMNQESAADLDEFDHLEQQHNYIFGYAKRLPCVAHQLTCVIRKCIDQSKDLQPVIKAAFRLVKAINKSTQKKESLIKHNDGKGLLSPSQTRWIYTYYVLQRLLASKEAVEMVVVEHGMENVALDALEWNQIEQLRDLLEPFAMSVNTLEGDSYTTLSKVFPTVIDLVEQMREKAVTRGIIGKAAQSLKSEMERRFQYVLDQYSASFQPAYLVSTFLEPDFLSGLLPDQRRTCIRFIIQQLTDGTMNQVMESSQPAGPAESTAVQAKYGHFFKRAHGIVAQNVDDRSKVLQSKLDAYVEEALHPPPTSATGPISAVEFWISKKEFYNEISSYALDLLVVPASSAGIERVFSLASIVQGNLRNRLGAGSLEKELMIKVNRDFLFS